MNKKLVSFILAVVMVFTASLALAKTVEPEDQETEHFAGKTVHATVGEYVESLKSFKVTVYENDRFDDDDIASLAAGDILLAGGRPYTIREMTKTADGEPMAVIEGEPEIIFVKNGDDYTAQLIDDDRQCLHAVAVLLLPAAEGIVYEDNSMPGEQMKTVQGLEEILKAKAEKEENSIGFDGYATTVTLNEQLEIVKIHQDFDVAQ